MTEAIIQHLQNAEKFKKLYEAEMQKVAKLALKNVNRLAKFKEHGFDLDDPTVPETEVIPDRRHEPKSLNEEIDDATVDGNSKSESPTISKKEEGKEKRGSSKNTPRTFQRDAKAQLIANGLVCHPREQPTHEDLTSDWEATLDPTPPSVTDAAPNQAPPPPAQAACVAAAPIQTQPITSTVLKTNSAPSTTSSSSQESPSVYKEKAITPLPVESTQIEGPEENVYFYVRGRSRNSKVIKGHGYTFYKYCAPSNMNPYFIFKCKGCSHFMFVDEHEKSEIGDQVKFVHFDSRYKQQCAPEVKK